MDKIKFGSYIKESRIKKNYTQQELADLLFVDVSAVSKWERGVSYPDITLVPDICRVLEISEHELIESSHDVEYRKMKNDAKTYNNMKKGTFWTLNISYAAAVLVCFIVNIAVSNTLSWFFIVLASIVCAYSFCPTITFAFTKYKKIVFLVSTFVSLFLLFLTCSIYNRDYWFMIAALGVLLGYFVVFYPGIFKSQKKYLKEERYDELSKFILLSYVLGIFIIISFLLISIYAYVPFNLKLALLINGGVCVIPIGFGVLNLFEISKMLNKPILLSLIGAFAILFVLAIGRSVYLKSTEVSKTYNIEDVYNDIKIKGNNFDINIYLADNGENKVVYVENKKVSVDSKVVDGILIINQNDSRMFFDKLFDFNGFKIDLYLSQDTINSLNIESSTGDIEINKGFIFNDVEISNSTGDIVLKSDVNSDLDVQNSTGDIRLYNSNIAGNVNLKSSTGDVELSGVKCNKLDINIGTGDILLIDVLVANDFNMKGSTGDVKFDGFDAGNIYVTVGTGDVKGTLLSSKIFIARSETGDVKVPETLTGGVCKVITSTGDIKISYK
jgi:transcriptional regulator with XRE-family HTH domain/DUF4097 and DUF4098 domain-containing protein YvlB